MNGRNYVYWMIAIASLSIIFHLANCAAQPVTNLRDITATPTATATQETGVRMFEDGSYRINGVPGCIAGSACANAEGTIQWFEDTSFIVTYPDGHTTTGQLISQ